MAFSIYAFVETLQENPGDVLGAILVGLESIIGLPLAIVFASFIYLPIGIVMMIIYGVSFVVGLVYSAASILLLNICLVFAILLLANVSASKSKNEINLKAMKRAKIFAIIGLVTLLIAGAPNVFSIISVLRYIFILVACITALIGASKGLKANKEQPKEE